MASIKSFLARARPGKPQIGPPQLRNLVASASQPLVYVNVPKSGCTTIKNILYYLDHGQYFIPPEGIHRSVSRGKALIKFHQQKRLEKILARPRLMFTFVRHPLKRAYSCFNEKIFHVHEFSFPGIRRRLQAEPYNLRFPESGDAYPLASHRRNFRGFLRFVRDSLAGGGDVRPNPHWAPQSRILENCRRHHEIDFIGRVEHFRRDMTNVLGHAPGAPIGELVNRRFNEGPPPPFRYADILTEGILALGQRIYAPDFREFGYAVDPGQVEPVAS